jgi:hypothetical protein
LSRFLLIALLGGIAPVALAEEPANSGAPAPAPSATPAPPTAAAPANPLATLSPCRRVVMPQGTREQIVSNINVGTRIQFASEIRTVETATPGLWDTNYNLNSVWIRPKTVSPEAADTGLSVFTTDGKQYDFLVNANATPQPSCVLVVDYPPPKAPDPVAANTAGQIAKLSRQVADLNDRLLQEEESHKKQLFDMRRQVEQQANDRINQFQYSVNTRYDWKGLGTNTDDQYLVGSVYDDGRFTYVRISTSAFGLPSFSGALGDKDTVLQYSYNDLTGVVTILGLYDQIRVKLGGHVIDVTRRG